MQIIIQDFSKVYQRQPFMQALHDVSMQQKNANGGEDSAINGYATTGTNKSGVKVHWIDCSEISGTDCYCDDEAQDTIRKAMDEVCDSKSKVASETIPSLHFFDNGNYHYMSKLWTDRISQPFSLIVFDHHPDMQPPRFGGILSCGGWIKETLENNKFIQNVIIIGVDDKLIGADTDAGKALQEECAHLLDKVTFIPESEVIKFQQQSGNRTSTPQANESQVSFFSSHLQTQKPSAATTLSQNIYLSIDKDALSTDFAATNWDQGSLSLDTLQKCIVELAATHKIVGIDICGERAHDFEGNEHLTQQSADALNNELNKNLVDFFASVEQKEHENK